MIRELYSHYGQKNILDAYLLQYSVSSPPFLFELSDHITPEKKKLYMAFWLNSRRILNEWNKFIKEDAELSRNIFGPSIPSMTNSPLRVLESKGWDDINSDGAFCVRTPDPLLLNLLCSPILPSMEPLWTCTSDIVDAYPHPTFNNPLPILKKQSKIRIESFSIPWMQCEFAQSMTLSFIEQEHKQIINCYGSYNQLQEEE